MVTTGSPRLPGHNCDRNVKEEPIKKTSSIVFVGLNRKTCLTPKIKLFLPVLKTVKHYYLTQQLLVESKNLYLPLIIFYGKKGFETAKRGC